MPASVEILSDDDPIHLGYYREPVARGSSPIKMPALTRRMGSPALPQTKSAYSLVQRWCHWLIVVLYLAMYPTAEAIRTSHIGHVFGIQGSAFDQIKAFAHEWGGWLALALTLALALSRLVQGTPPLPDGMARWQRFLAHTTHVAIYAGLLALVGSGAAAMYVGGTYGQMHVTLAKTGLALIAVHLLGVFWH